MEKELLILLENDKGDRYGVYHLPKNPTNFVCWAVGNKEFNKGNTFWGNYFIDFDSAIIDMLERTGKNYKIVKTEIGTKVLKKIEKKSKK